MSDEIIKICEDPKSIKLDNALFWLANPKKMKYARSRGIFSDVPKKLLNSKLCMDNKLRGMDSCAGNITTQYYFKKLSSNFIT